jgi:hypothetical protein
MPKLDHLGRTLSETRTALVPAGWVESLERSKAQIEAGQTLPIEPALDRLRASIARMEAKRAEANKK